MSNRVESRVDFSPIRYANCWEDADILCDALQPAAGKRILSIASAGDNSLALAAEGAEVVAVDLSEAQIACLELRRAAFRTLEHPELLRFLGVHEDDARPATFERLASQLPERTRDYWVAHRDVVASGVIHAGKFERYFHLFRRRVLPLVHSRRMVGRLVEPKDLSLRNDFYEKRWNTWRWRAVFKVFFSRRLMGRLGRDPEFFRYVEGSVADRILDRARYALVELPTHDNPYLDYILFGNFRNALPRYLRSENFDKTRSGVDRLKVVHGPIDRAIEEYGATGFDGFNLSDIFEYLDADTCERLFSQLTDASRLGARYAYWNMLAPRCRPESLAKQVEPMEELSAQLFARDRAFFYSRFVVEQRA
jgi:S-adenosylmethionine-diacylglycerol 3-amino-3-carboxypropyl transferase